MHKISSFFFSFLVSVIIFSCVESKESTTFTHEGVWEQNGYGRIMVLSDTLANFYDVSRKSCNPSFTEPLIEIGKIINLTDHSLTLLHGINEYHFEKLKELPDLCSDLHQSDNKSPIKNFEALWYTFNEQYAYFDIREIDWQKEYLKYRSSITDETSELELYEILNEMVSVLGDGHAKLEMPEDLLAQYDKGEEKPAAEKPQEVKRSVHSMRQEYKDILCNHYLSTVKKYNSGVVRWGMMEGNIAYVQINWMILLGNYNLPNDLTFREFWGEYWAIAESREEQRNDEIKGARMIMDSIVQDLASAKAFVVDLRFNGGGKDDAALEFISHFTDSDKKVFTKKAKLENGFTKPQEIVLESAERIFGGPVYLLISPQTASAAEIMTLSSMAIPQITRIGSNTEGIFSDMLDKVLPNGWEYSLSNEVYENDEGKNYENIGLPAEYSMDYPREAREMYLGMLEDFDDGDRAIDLAISLAQLK